MATKEYKFAQVRKALDNHGFEPTRNILDESWCTTFFEKSSGTQYGSEFATVEEWLKDGTCTINGICPKAWGENNL
mgnify:CR=1 FL=1